MSNQKTDDVLDMYPLTPLQQGILFEVLNAPQTSTYFEQQCLTLQGPLMAEAFQRAWQTVIDRHPILRTIFLWERRQAPLQVVRRQATLPWHYEDWSALAVAEQEARREDFLRQDRSRGFVTSQAPLMRAALIKIAPAKHYFVWSFHHILLDGWSISIVYEEAFALYYAECKRQPLRLPEPRPYRDFIAWLKQQDVKKAEQFWRRNLQGFTVPTPLHVDGRSAAGATNDRSATAPEAGAEVQSHMFHLTADTQRSLQALARQHKVTLNTVFMSAWALLLSRYSGESDVVFGMVVAGRTLSLPGSEKTVGLFINTVPVRVETSDDERLATWLQKVQSEYLEREQYSYTDLSKIHGWSEVPRGTRLFNSLYVFENYPLEQKAQAGDRDEISLLAARNFTQTGYPLNVGVLPDGLGQLAVVLVYDPVRFSTAVIARMADHYQQLLGSMVGAQRLAELSLLTPAERQHLLVDLNQTRVPQIKDRCIHELVQEKGRQSPDAVAVVFGEQQLTYRELNSRANQLAHYLRSLGVGPETLVGICVKRSLEMMVGLLGILKSGAAYVPIDPNYPQDRIDFMLSDTQVPVLLTQHKLQPNLANFRGHCCRLDADWPAIAACSDQDPDLKSAPQQLAYVIYTSGSTGTPKGVLIEHGSVLNLISWYWKEFHITAQDRAAQVARFAFDASVWEIWAHLTCGARVYLLPQDEVATSPTALRDWFVEQQITVSFLTTALAEQLFPLPWARHTALRWLFFGGDKLHRFSGYDLPFAVVHCYGPTETTVFATTTVLAQDRAAGTAPPIGRPLYNTQLYILDERLHPVPIGIPGELYIGGDGLARGYHRRPELTGEKFVANPFYTNGNFAVPSARLYKTGDRVRYLPEVSGEPCQVEFIGRADQQVKIRGFRVEPGEIEAKLIDHPAVREVAVIAREDEPGQKRLVAYIVAHDAAARRGDEPALVAALRTFLQQWLPDYMMPAAFQFLDTMPLTPNGKLNRRALPQPETVATTAAYEAPANETEQKLTKVWSEVLKIQHIGRHDDFFELGGDSIIAILVVSRAKQVDLQLTPKDIFNQPTIAELAAVATVGKAKTSEQGVIIGEVPLTPIQRWFFAHHEVEPHHGNQTYCFIVPPDLDLGALHQAVRYLQTYHDVLRARYVQRDGSWRQSFAAPNQDLTVGYVDLSALADDRRAERISEESARLQASLNLSAGPPMCLTWFYFGAAQPGRLLWVIHHLVVDGVSWRILEADLNAVYEQLRRKQRPTLPPKTTHFKAWAEWLQQYAQSAPLLAQRDYWLALPAAPPLPVDRTAAPAENITSSEQRIPCTFSAAETHSLLTAAPAAYRTQINDLLLAALALTLQEWTGSSTSLIDLEGHGRETPTSTGKETAAPDLSRTVGWFTSIFPFALTVPPAAAPPDLGQVIKSIKEQLRAVPDRGLGYGILRYLQGEAFSRQSMATAEISFNYLGQFAHAAQTANPGEQGTSQLISGVDEVDLGAPSSPRQQRSHLLGLNGWVERDTLTFEWSYSEKFHRAETVQWLTATFAGTLRALIAHCVQNPLGGYTPSDFPDSGLTQSQLDTQVRAITEAQTKVAGQSGVRIDALFPLTPSQQGMFLGSLAQRASGLYVEQLVLTLNGPLRRELFAESFQKLSARHAIFRTGFSALNPLHPLQYTLGQASVPWVQEDWRGLSAAAQVAALAAYVQHDRQRDFDLARAPLVRLALFQTGDESHQFVLTQHHILLDGWSQAIVVDELFKLYEAACAEAMPPLPPVQPFQTYVAWLGRQDWVKAEAFWRERLRGFTRPLALDATKGSSRASASAVQHDGAYHDYHGQLSASASAALQLLVKQHRLTMSTLLQGIWALLLYRCSGESDVVLGATTSGRPATLPGVESMVGMFINTLPIRIQILPTARLWPWLQSLQRSVQAQQPYEFCSAGQVHQWSEVPSAMPLYESLLVYENYPVDPAAHRPDGTLRIGEFRALGSHTNCPITVIAECQDALELRIVYDTRRLIATDAECLSTHFLSLLLAISSTIPAESDLTEQTLGGLLDRLPIGALPTFFPRDVKAQRGAGVQPRDGFEEQLTSIWRSVFGPSVGVEDSFFELGGHSLSAIQIMTRVENLYQRNLPVTLLFKYPTIAKLAKLLRSQTAIPRDEEGLIVMGGQGSKTPLFLSPGGGSDAIYFYELSEQLSPDQPVYGLRPAGLDGKSPPSQTIEEAASHHILSMQAVQPHGPYLLLGHSSGAHVAFEIAQQLMRQNEKVVLLAVVDMFAPVTIHEHLNFAPKDELQNLISYAETLQPFTAKKIELSRAQLAPLSPADRIAALKQALVAANLLLDDTDERRLRAAVMVAQATGEMVPRYKPQSPRPLPIVLFRVVERAPTADELTIPIISGDGGWGLYGPTQVHTVPGNHFTMVNEPHVATLGEKLEAQLCQVHAQARGETR